MTSKRNVRGAQIKAIYIIDMEWAMCILSLLLQPHKGLQRYWIRYGWREPSNSRELNSHKVGLRHPSARAKSNENERKLLLLVSQALIGSEVTRKAFLLTRTQEQ
jgi:hypothetical protein